MLDALEAAVEFVYGIMNTLFVGKVTEIILALKTKQDVNVRVTMTPPLKYL